MTHYVLGFAFTKDYSLFERVLLIRKTKPEWQAGKLNGVGGKIEREDVDPHWAMFREFKEETGLRVLPKDWRRFAIMEFPHARIHCFATWLPWNEFKLARDTTEERLEHYQIDLEFSEKMKNHDALLNLLWLIPMARVAWDTVLPVLHIKEDEDINKRFYS